MLKLGPAADRSRFMVTEKAHHFPAEVFESFSRDELLTVLSLMHRAFAAHRRRDVKRIVTELPTLFANHLDIRDGRGIDRSTGGLSGGGLTTRDDAYHLLKAFLTRLSIAQNRIHSAGARRLASTQEPSHLSPREMTVLSWMKEGKTNDEIASVLGLRERTVRFYVSSILEKLDVTSRTQAVAKAMGAGLIAS